MTYKVLNKERTQGEWTASINYIGTNGIRITHVNGTLDEKEDVANAQYIALAVNNLHVLAEALEALLEITPNTQAEYKKAKKALSNIS